MTLLLNSYRKEVLRFIFYDQKKVVLTIKEKMCNNFGDECGLWQLDVNS